MIKRGFTTLALILLVVGLLAGGFAVFVYFQFTQEPTTETITKSSPIPTEETADWKKYISGNYTIKYPSDLSLTESTEKTLPGSNRVTLKNDTLLENNFIVIDTWVNSQNKTLQQFITDHTNGLYTKDNTNTYQIGELEWSGYIDRVGKTVFIANKDKVYIAILNKNAPYNSETSNTLNKTAEDIFNQILSTFQFTEGNTKDLSTSLISPYGTYTVSENRLGDYNTISIYDKKGKIITEDLIVDNEERIGYGEKFGCQCGTSFKGWLSDDKFAIKIVNGLGEEYEYLVDAATGLVDEDSFRKIK